MERAYIFWTTQKKFKLYYEFLPYFAMYTTVHFHKTFLHFRKYTIILTISDYTHLNTFVINLHERLRSTYYVILTKSVSLTALKYDLLW